jgi:hypothetical protein
MAQETGGSAFVGTNGIDRALHRVVEDASHYYLLGVAADIAERRAGTFEPLTVRVRHRGVVVQARTGYDPTFDEHSERPAATTIANLATGLVPARQFTVGMRASAFRGDAGWTKVVVAMDATLPPHDPQSTLEYAIIGADDRGRIVDSTDGHVRAPTQAGVARVMAELSLKPGIATIKGAVRLGSGEVGSAFVNLTIPDFGRNQLVVSGLELDAEPDSSALLTGPPPLVRATGAQSVTAQGAFGSSELLKAYAELYNVPDSVLVQGQCVLTGSQGERRQRALDVKRLSAGDENQYVVACQLPLEGLEEGTYNLRVAVQAGHAEASRSMSLAVLGK